MHELSVSGGFIDSPQISTRLEAAYRIYALDIFHPAFVPLDRRLNPRILSAHSKKYIYSGYSYPPPRLTPEWDGTTNDGAECMSLSGRAAGRRGSRFGLREETQDRGIIFVPLRFIGPTGSTQIPQTEVIAERAQTPFRPRNPNLIRCPISRHASLSEPSLLLAQFCPRSTATCPVRR